MTNLTKPFALALLTSWYNLLRSPLCYLLNFYSSFTSRLVYTPQNRHKGTSGDARHRLGHWPTVLVHCLIHCFSICSIMFCARIFTFLSFLQSQFVNHVFKLLQRLGDGVPRPTIGALPLDPTEDFRPPTLWLYPQWKFLAPPLHTIYVKLVGKGQGSKFKVT